MKNLSILLISILLFIFCSNNLKSQERLIEWRFQDTVEPVILEPLITGTNISISSGTVGFQVGTSEFGDRIANASSWSQDVNFNTTGKYLEFSINTNGNQIALENLVLNFSRTAAGPSLLTIRYSIDNFENYTDLISDYSVTSTTTNVATMNKFESDQIFSDFNGEVKFRIWGYNASGTGNLRFTDFIIEGSILSNPSAPAISLDTTGLDTDFSYLLAGDSSDIRSYSVSAQNLTEGLLIGPPANVELSLVEAFNDEIYTSSNPLSLVPTDGDVSATIWLRYKIDEAETAIDLSGTIVHSSADASPQNLDLSAQRITAVGDISTLRAGEMDGRMYQLTTAALLHSQQSLRNQKWISDADASIMIDDPDGNISSTYSIGDSIPAGLTGSLSLLDGVLVVTPLNGFDPGAASSTGNAIEPVVISLEDFVNNFADYESQLVQIDSVTFYQAGEVFANEQNYTVSQGAENTLFRTYFSEFDGESLPYGFLNVTAIAAQNSGSPLLWGRSTADFSDSYAPVFTASPTIDSETSEGFRLNALINEPGSIYYVVLAEGSAAPDSAQVRDGLDAADEAALTAGQFSVSASQIDAEEVQSNIITGLDANTNYDVYIIAQDSNANLQAVPQLLEVATESDAIDFTSMVEEADSPIAATELISNTAVGSFTPLFNVKVTDIGTDELPTIIEKVRFDVSAGNTTDWEVRIADIQLYNATDEEIVAATTAIYSDSLVFEIDENALQVSDNSFLELVLRVQLSDSLQDGEQLQFEVGENAAGWLLASSASSQFDPVIAAVQSNLHTINVEATQFSLQVSPLSFDLNLNNAFDVSVTAFDDFNNVDTSERIISLSVILGDGAIFPSENLSDQSMSNGFYEWTDLTYSQADTFQISVSDGVIIESSDNIVVTEFVPDIHETFDNTNFSGAAYQAGSFEGERGVIWTYEEARNRSLDGKAIQLRNNTTSKLEAIIPGGIDELVFNYSQEFTGNINLGIYINESLVDSVTTDSEQGSIKLSPILSIDSTGNNRLKFQNLSGGAQVTIDNVQWTSNSGCDTPENQISASSPANLVSNSLELNWTKGDGTHTLVVLRPDEPVTFYPENSIIYDSNLDFSEADSLTDNNRILYAGDLSSISISGLEELTTYHYAIFTYNEAEQCYNPFLPERAEFTTLCQEPETAASLAQAIEIEGTLANISWTKGSGSNTLVVAKKDASPSGLPESGTLYNADSTFSDALELASDEKLVYTGTDSLFTLLGLEPLSTYHLAFYTYDTANLCYLTDSPATLSFETESLYDANSTLFENDQLEAITLISNELIEQAQAVFHFTIDDLGSDGAPTIVQELLILAGDENELNFENQLAEIVLFDRNDTAIPIDSSIIKQDSLLLRFNVTDLEIADGESRELQLQIRTLESLSEELKIQFQIPAEHAFMADALNGTLFESTLSQAIVGNVHTVDIVASQLKFDSHTSEQIAGLPFSASVSAYDDYDNIDTDANQPVTLAVNVGNGQLSSLNGLTQNLENGSYSWSDLVLDAADSFKLEANAPGLTAAISDSIYITEATFAQLPVLREDFAAPHPDGWIHENSTDLYANNASRFDETGQYLLIRLDDEPGNLVFELTSFSFSGGTFSIQESENGVTYSEALQLTSEITGSYQSFDVTLDRDSRFIKFIYTEKVTGNVGIRKIAIEPAPCLGPAQVSDASVNAITSSTAEISWTSTEGNSLVVIREGEAVSFEPVEGESYTPDSDVEAATDLGDGNKVVFSDSGESVSLINLNNDVTYHIALFSYQDGCYTLTNAATASFTTPFCDSPENPASDLLVDNITSSSADINWTADAEVSSLLLIKANEAVDFVPELGTDYAADASPDLVLATEISAGNKVLFAGSSSGVSAINLTQGSTYHLAVYVYDSESNCYLLDEALRTSFTTETPLDTDSQILAPDEQIAASSIASTANDVISAVDVFRFKLADLGTSDEEPTLVSRIRIVSGAENTIGDWSLAIAGVKLKNADGEIPNANYAINAERIDITFAEGQELEVKNATDTTLTLAIWLSREGVNDEDILQFEIGESHQFLSSAEGSIFSTTIAESITSNQFAVDEIIDDISIVRTYTNQSYTLVQGIVSSLEFGSATNTRFYVQDETAGLLVSSSSKLEGIEVGQLVKVKGRKSTASSNVIIDFGSVEIMATDQEIPTPTLVNIADLVLGDPIVGSRIRIENVQLTDYSLWPTSALTTAGRDIAISDGENELTLRVHRNSAYYKGLVDVPYGQLDLEGVLERVSDDLKIYISLDSDVQDNYAAVFAAGSPSLSGLTFEGAILNVQLNEPATLYGVVLERDAAAPSISQIISGENAEGQAALQSIELNYLAENLGSTLSEQISGLDADSQYDLYVVAVDANDNIQENSTKLEINTLSATLDNDSHLSESDSPIASQELSALLNTEEEAIAVFNFNISDAGTSDGLPTILEKINLTAASENSANWNSVLAGAYLNVNDDTLYASSIGASSIQFDLAANPYEVVDGTIAEFELFLWLSSEQTDGANIQLAISQNPIVSTEGSQLSNLTVVNSAVHQIQVEATELEIEAPAIITENRSFELNVSAVDANGNIDLAERTISLTLAAGNGTLGGESLENVSMLNGQYTFSDLSYGVVEVIQLNVSDGELSNSATIEVEAFSGGGLETFTNSTASGTYGDGSFVGDDGFSWTFYEARNGNNDANESGIDLPALMLRNLTDSSRIISDSINGGISNFSVKLYKGFSAAGNRQVELLINGESKGFSTPFDNFEEQVFELNNINVEGDFVMEIRNATNNQVIIDDISWEGFEKCDAPETQASSIVVSEIDSYAATVRWTAGSGNSSILIASQETAVSFLPLQGKDYSNEANTDWLSAGFIDGQHKVLYVGNETEVTITNLDENTNYHLAVYTFDQEGFCYQTLEPAKTEFTSAKRIDNDALVEVANEPIPSQLINSNNAQIEATSLFRFTISDQGGGDELPIIINQLALNVEGIAWINEAMLIDQHSQDTLNSSFTVNGASLLFTFENGLIIEDGESITIDVQLSLVEQLTDNSTIQLSIPTTLANWVIDEEGTQFASNYEVDISSALHNLDVVALSFEIEGPATARQNEPFSISISAVDQWGNLDTDDRTINISLANGSGILSGNTEAIAMEAGQVTLNDLTFDQQDIINLVVSDGQIEGISEEIEIIGPTIRLETNSFDGDFGQVTYPNASEARSYQLTASNLSEAVQISPPLGFQLSASAAFDNVVVHGESLSINPVNGEIANAEIYVRFVPLAADEALYEGDIIHSSANADSLRLSVVGQEASEQIELISIAEVKSLEAGSPVRIKGTVIGGPNNEITNRVINDGSGGIIIRQQSGSNATSQLFVGDVVELEGVLTNSGNELIVSQISELLILETNSGIQDSLQTSITEILQDPSLWEGHFVKIGPIQIDDERTSFEGGGTEGDYLIKQADAEMIFRIGLNTHSLVGQDIPQDSVSLIGYIVNHQGVPKIFINSANDLLIHNVPQPELQLSVNELNFGELNKDENTSILSYRINAVDVNGSLKIGVSENFEISLSENADFGAELMIESSDNSIDTTVFVRVILNENTPNGELNGEISHEIGELNESLMLSAMIAEIASVDNFLATQLLIYPIPAGDKLNIIHINGEIIREIKLFDMQGKLQLVQANDESRIIIDINKLKNGLYQLFIVTDKGTQSLKIVVKK